MGVFKPDRLTTQPPASPNIDWGNPITKGLVFAFEPNTGMRNIAVGNVGSARGTGVTEAQGQFGREYSYSGSQASGTCSFGVLKGLSGATEATYEILVKFNAANPGSHFYGQWDGSFNMFLLQGNGSGGMVWVAAQDASSNRRRWDATGLFSTAGYYHIIASWQGGANKVLLVNGVDKTSSLSVVNAVANEIGVGVVTDAVQLGMVSGGTALAGSVVFARHWKRGLTKGELLSLSNNPYQIFKAPSRKIFLPSVGGASDHSLTANNITTATPVVGTPVLTQDHVATGAGIATSAATLGTPALTQDHVITAIAISTSPATLGNPVLSASDTYALTADAITTAAATLGTPSLTQDHTLIGGAIAAGSPTFGPLTLEQQHALVATGITTSPATLANPVLSGELFTAEQLAYLLAYMQENLMIPTAAEIAAAVIAAAQAAPIHAEIKMVAGSVISGGGTAANPWRP